MGKMEYAMTAVPAAPVRAKASHRSEMISQLLFGESVRVLRSKGSLWVKVRSLHDKYEGWMTTTQLLAVKEEKAKAYCKYVTSRLLQSVEMDGREIKIPLGSSLPGIAGAAGDMGGHTYHLEGKYSDRLLVKPSEETVKLLSLEWLNAPYLWGGRTILGVDCSGFVQVIHKLMGIDLPRDAWQQAGEGKTVKKFKDIRCGDLAFFDDDEEIVHVGILLGEGRIIHASGRVRIDTIDKKGIINSDSKKRTHYLRVIKRVW